MILLVQNVVYAQNTRETTYNYNYWGNANEDIPFFELLTTIDKDNMGETKLSSVDDIYVFENRIFVIDGVESRLNVFNDKFELLASIKTVRDKNGKIALNEKTGEQIILKSPEGVFYHKESDEIYIADTGNERIVVIDGSDYTFKRMITAPTNMVGATVFKPSKVVVDRINRIYVVVQSGFEGIIELNSEGEFVRYFGVNKPKVNLIDYFWRQRASEEQKKKMQKVLAPSFNNIELDADGFVYATTFDSGAQQPVFRLNPKGQNVINENGYWPVIGDLDEKNPKSTEKRESAFVDIALTDYGTYALLDKSNGRIFIYNFDGELMNIFGGKGFMKGQLNEPTSIAWLGDKLLVGDKQMKCMYVFTPTYFGELALKASEEYFNGNWDGATALLEEAVAINSNFESAYVTIGKSYLMKEDYDTAMRYFKLSNDRTYYSKAFNGYRGIWIQDHFIWIFLIAIILIGSLFYSEYRYFKKQKK